MIVETDNPEAFQIIRNFSVGAPATYYHIASQIDILMNNNTWVCGLNFVFPAHNRVARFAARLCMEVCEHLYTLYHPVCGIEDLVEWDLGLGFDHHDFRISLFLTMPLTQLTLMWMWALLVKFMY